MIFSIPWIYSDKKWYPKIKDISRKNKTCTVTLFPIEALIFVS